MAIKFKAKLATVFTQTKEMLLADFEKKMEKQRAAIEEDGPENGFFVAFEKAVNAHFEDNSQYTFVAWVQATDEWNDGEECNFDIQHGEAYSFEKTPDDEEAFKKLFETGIFDHDDAHGDWRTPFFKFLDNHQDELQALFGEADVGISNEGTIFVTYHEHQNVPQGSSNPFLND